MVTNDGGMVAIEFAGDWHEEADERSWIEVDNKGKQAY